MSCARPERPLCKCQSETLRFQRPGGIAAQAMAQHRHERLCAGIDSKALRTKCQSCLVVEKSKWREFPQQRFGDGERQTRVATGDRVAHTIPFVGVEKEHLVRLGYGLVVPNMTDVDAAVREDKFCRGCPFFGTFVPAPALAAHVADGNGRRLEQKLNGDLGRRFSLGPFHMVRFSWIGGAFLKRGSEGESTACLTAEPMLGY